MTANYGTDDMVEPSMKSDDQLRVKRLLEERRVLNDLAVALGQSTSFQEIYGQIHEHVVQLMDVSSFIISLFDAPTETITAGFVYGEGEIIDPELLPPLKLEAPGKGTQSQVIRTGQPMIVNDLSGPMAELEVQYEFTPEGKVVPGPPTPEEEEVSTKSELLAPMLLEGEVIGVVALQSHRLNAYTEQDRDLLCGIANLAAVAIHNQHLIRRLEATAEHLDQALNQTIEMTARVTEMRDPYTSAHQERVAELALAIADAMNLPETHRKGLRIAALLHDVGKLSVPADILNKPSRLSETEMRLVRAHAESSSEALEGLEFDAPVQAIVLQHHENLDGSGYPAGLAGDDILLEARILRVADAYEAMTSHRPYRPAMQLEAVLAELKDGRGSLYDSEVVAACLELIAGGFTFTLASG